MVCSKSCSSDFLPTRESRLALYYLLEKAIHRRIHTLHHLEDSSTELGFLSNKREPIVLEASCRGRQISFHRHESLPLFAAALHLSILKDLQSRESIITRVNPDEIVTCLTLLLSNILLLSKGKYDARIRSVVKEVSISILKGACTDEGTATESITEPTITTSSKSYINCNVNLDEDVLPSPTALYILSEEAVKTSTNSKNRKKESKKKSLEDQDSKMDEDWQNFKIELESSHLQNARHQFEAMEKVIATKILHKFLMEEQKDDSNDAKSKTGNSSSPVKKRGWVRGLQIGTVSVVVGGLFAVTGGLAAPGLVAAISAFGVASAIPAFAALTHTAALASMFGVVGGGLAAYKMKKRTGDLNEWRIRKENVIESDNKTKPTLRGLHAVVCVSGWLHEAQDFQQPWGIQANDPHLNDELQLLQKFFSVFAPQKLPFCKPLLQSHTKSRAKKTKKTNYDDLLWYRLEEKYGRNPKKLLPLDKSQMDHPLRREMLDEINVFLSEAVFTQVSKMEEMHVQNSMLVRMESMNAEVFANLDIETLEAMQAFKIEQNTETYSDLLEDKCKQFNKLAEGDINQQDLVDGEASGEANDREEEPKSHYIEPIQKSHKVNELKDEKEYDKMLDTEAIEQDNLATLAPSFKENKIEEDQSDVTVSTASSNGSETSEPGEGDKKSLSDESSHIEASVQINTHSHIVWDWEAHYSGEIYTVTWESERLLQLCRVVEVLFREISEQIKKEILKQTFIGGMVSAVALPSTLSTCTAVLDDPYQIISFRSEKAGVELARCLLESEEGRPVSLVGFSFGARVIFSALLELAKHQEKWEKQQKLLSASLENDEQEGERQLIVEHDLASKGSENSGKKDKSRSSGESNEIYYQREPASLVEDVVLIGMPSIINSKEWIQCREIVAGRLVNCYHKSDWILSYMINIRCWNAFVKTCGTHSIEIKGVENYEISHICPSHWRYPLVIPQILHHIKFGANDNEDN